jgi:hypothetical protein
MRPEIFQWVPGSAVNRGLTPDDHFSPSAGRWRVFRPGELTRKPRPPLHAWRRTRVAQCVAFTRAASTAFSTFGTALCNRDMRDTIR